MQIEPEKLLNYEYICPTCGQGFNGVGATKKLNEHVEKHREGISLGRPEKIFLFATYDDRVIPYNEKHALVFGLNNPRFFKEYLGMIETNDPNILNKSVEEIKAMNLPRIRPRELRRTYVGPQSQAIGDALNQML